MLVAKKSASPAKEKALVIRRGVPTYVAAEGSKSASSFDRRSWCMNMVPSMSTTPATACLHHLCILVRRDTDGLQATRACLLSHTLAPTPRASSSAVARTRRPHPCLRGDHRRARLQLPGERAVLCNPRLCTRGVARGDGDQRRILTPCMARAFFFAMFAVPRMPTRMVSADGRHVSVPRTPTEPTARGEHRQTQTDTRSS